MVWESILLYLWETFKLWLFTIFVAPFKNFNMLWILIPIYLGWFFAEFFQEKVGTSMGNAISNSVVVFWGGFDWMRGTITKMTSGALAFGAGAIARVLLAFFLVVYGVLIIILGIKGNKLIKYIGRIREVTYVVIMFTPIFYDVIPFTWQHLLATFLFFPIFYFVIELIDHYMPNPKAIVQDMEEAGGGKPEEKGLGADLGGLGGAGGADVFGKGGSSDLGGFDMKGGMGGMKL
ncbi:MAG: hypothetical protein KJ574_05235 [Nanoarchaeota archaeon]|nr:hypothetical protein [Nanoarchaeota archaeon]